MEVAFIVDGKAEPSRPVGKSLERIFLELACLEAALVDAERGEHGKPMGMTHVEQLIQMPPGAIQAMPRLVPVSPAFLRQITV